MFRRLVPFLFAGVLSAGVACVGTDPEPRNDLGLSSGGSSGAGGPVDADSVAAAAAVTLRVDPIVIVRGDTKRVQVQVARRNLGSTITLSLRGAPAGVRAVDAIVPPESTSAEILFDTDDDAPYGDYSPVLTANAAGLPETSVTAPLQVRGAPGALDTSYGSGGLGAQVPNGMIGDAMMDSEGRLVISGGYDAAAEAVLMARLTPTGQLDPSFATNGLLRWSAPFAHLAHPEMNAGYYRCGTIEYDGRYSMTAYYQNGPTSTTSAVVHAEVSLAGAAPSFVPAVDPADLGSYYAGSRTIRDVNHTDGTGFFVLRRGHVARYLANNTPDPNFGVAGKSEAVGDYFVDGVSTKDRIHAIVMQGNPVVYRAVTVTTGEVGSGKVLLSGREGETSSVRVRLSRPNAAGHALAAYGRTLRDLAPDGTQTDRKGTRYDGSLPGGTADGLFPFYFADGNLGAVVLSSPPLLHVLSPTGEQLTVRDGIALEGADLTPFRQGGIVEVFPDARGGIVVVFATEDLGGSWVVRRYFL